jgi:hypothetical protein
MVNPAYHKFVQDENRMLRERLLSLIKENEDLQCELLDIRDLLTWHEQKALPFKGFGAVVHQSMQEEAHA